MFFSQILCSNNRTPGIGGINMKRIFIIKINSNIDINVKDTKNTQV